MPPQLSYAGYPLAYPDEATRAHVAATIDPRHVYDFARQQWPGRNFPGLTWPGTTDPRPVDLNSLSWPRGASAWSVFYALADKPTADEIRRKVYHQSDRYRPLPFVLDAGDKRIDGVARLRVETELYLLPPRPLAQRGKFTDLYILPLVDDRFFWWQRSDTFSVLHDWTWATLFDRIADALGIALEVPEVDAAYLRPPQDLTSRYDYLAPLLDAAAYSCGLRFVRKLDGTHKLQTATEAHDSAEAFADELKVAGGRFLFRPGDQLNDRDAALPAAVRVVYSPVRNTTLYCDPYSKTVQLSDLQDDPKLNGAVGNAETRTFHSTAAAAFDSAGNVQNQAELDALAQRIAADWYVWQLAAYDVAFGLAMPYEVDGLAESVVWRADPGGVTCRVQRGPWHDLVAEVMHASPTYGSTAAVDDVQIVRVVSGPDEEGYYDGWVQRFDPTTRIWYDVVPCWVRDANT